MNGARTPIYLTQACLPTNFRWRETGVVFCATVTVFILALQPCCLSHLSGSSKEMARHLELYYFPASLYSMKVRMYLSEKGAKAKYHIVDLRKGEHLAPDFLRLNPKGQVPVLRTSDATVPDSHEIYKYGEENIAGNTLVPVDVASDVWRLHDSLHDLDMALLTFGCLAQPKLAAAVKIRDSWKKKLENHAANYKKMVEQRMAAAPADQVHLLNAKAQAVGELAKKLKNEAAVEAVADRVFSVLTQCERQLEKSGGPFLFGGTVTVADIDLIVLIIRIRMLGLKKLLPKDERPKLYSFIASMEKRESYKIILKDSETFGAPICSIGAYIGSAALVLGIAVGIGLLIYFKRRDH